VTSGAQRPAGRARAWLEIMRVSNAPTVLSNAFAGAVLGSLAGGRAPFDALDARAPVVAAPLLCYVGGMILNDAFDAAIDARERPSRPIPSGRIPRTHAFAAGFALLAAAIALAAATGSAAAVLLTAVLAALVVAYDLVHAATAASVLLLAACRALAALAPMCVFAGATIERLPSGAMLVHPTLLAAWTAALSILARGEVARGGPRRLVTPRTIGFLIAALALVDAACLAAAARAEALVCVACAAATVLMQRRIAGS
jgi:4-hydroxybenzoate polyprenyltransferase